MKRENSDTTWERDQRKRSGLVAVIGPKCSCAPDWSHSDMVETQPSGSIGRELASLAITLYAHCISTLMHNGRKFAQLCGSSLMQTLNSSRFDIHFFLLAQGSWRSSTSQRLGRRDVHHQRRAEGATAVHLSGAQRCAVGRYLMRERNPPPLECTH